MKLEPDTTFSFSNCPHGNYLATTSCTKCHRTRWLLVMQQLFLRWCYLFLHGYWRRECSWTVWREGRIVTIASVITYKGKMRGTRIFYEELV